MFLALALFCISGIQYNIRQCQNITSLPFLSSIISMTQVHRLLHQCSTQLCNLKSLLDRGILSLPADQLQLKDNYDKFLKYLKKQYKDGRIGDSQVGILEALNGEIREFWERSVWVFRRVKSDFQALGEIGYWGLKDINTYAKLEPQILINSKDANLPQLRNNIHLFTLQTLMQKTSQILQHILASSSVALSPSQKQSLAQLPVQICKNYNIMPFHNFTHGFGVFLSFYCLAQFQGIRGLLQKDKKLNGNGNGDEQIPDVVFWLIACLAHDIQHQGVNTLFQVKTNSQKSVAFGKFGVMEKMHLAKTLEIFVKKQATNKFYQGLSQSQKQNSRKIISRAILSTDMSKHYEYVSMLSSASTPPQLLLESLVHACDIQNPALNHQSYLHWAHLICLQFHNQTLLQSELQIEITDFLKFDSLTYFYKNQNNFVSTIVLPLWKAVEEKWPVVKQRDYSGRIGKNLAMLGDGLRRNSEKGSIGIHLGKLLGK